MEYIEKEDTEFVENIIKKYSQIFPIKNNVLDIPIFDTTYKLIRLNDEQYSMLRKNCVTLLDDYGFLMDTNFMLIKAGIVKYFIFNFAVRSFSQFISTFFCYF